MCAIFRPSKIDWKCAALSIQKEMFGSCYTATSAVPPLPDMGEFTAAGTMFTNGNTVLAGYQKEDRSPSIHGIGGKREGSETYMQTALRETVEELFAVRKVPASLIKTLESALKSTRVHKSDSYVLVVYTFTDLETLLKLAAAALKTSPLYSTFPKTISSLIFDRNPDVEPRPEIVHLCVLPVVKGCFIDSQLLEDFLIIKPDLAKEGMPRFML